VTDSIPASVSHQSTYERGSQRREVRPAANDVGMAPKSKFVAKGHDAQLQDAQYGKFPVRVRLASGDQYWAQVVKRDKFTITFKCLKGEEAGLEEIVYKHAIESLLLDRDSVLFNKAA
jgi:sRNA-binding regulator protein Hfq